MFCFPSGIQYSHGNPTTPDSCHIGPKGLRQEEQSHSLHHVLSARD